MLRKPSRKTSFQTWRGSAHALAASVISGRASDESQEKESIFSPLREREEQQKGDNQGQMAGVGREPNTGQLNDAGEMGEYRASLPKTPTIWSQTTTTTNTRPPTFTQMKIVERKTSTRAIIGLLE